MGFRSRKLKEVPGYQLLNLTLKLFNKRGTNSNFWKSLVQLLVTVKARKWLPALSFEQKMKHIFSEMTVLRPVIYKYVGCITRLWFPLNRHIF